MINTKRAGLEESGVPWIGALPSDWEVMPAKALFSNPSEASLSTDVHLTPSQKYGVLPQVEYMEITGSRVVLNLSGAENMKHIEPGDFVSHLRSFQGGLEYSNYSGKVSNAYTALRPRKEFNHRFFQYLFKSNMYVQGLQTTTDQLRDGQSIRYGQFALLPLPLPPREEQVAIAEFLDRETAQIDELIEKQRQLIETLIERRQAEIFSTVTRGVDEDISQKSAGVDWISSIPQTWRVAKIGHLFGVIGSGTTPKADEQSYYGGDIPWVTTGELRENEILTTAKNVTAKALHDYSALKVFPKGSLVMALYGATIGRLGFLGVEAAVNQACCVMGDPLGISPRYVFYALQAFKERLLAQSVGGSQPNIGQDIVRQFRITVPPLKAQKEIVEYLDAAIDQISTLISRAESMIELLTERRQALVSEAVTGKIDVLGK